LAVKSSGVLVQKVLNWYEAVGVATKQVSTGKLDKALFSFLRISGTDLEPSQIIWLAYCLEGLFGTEIGKTFADLWSRIKFFLVPPMKIEKGVKKSLRKFYDLRSSIAHGGHKVAHPLQAEELDSSIDEYVERFMSPSSFAAQLILATLQKLVSGGWTEVEFESRPFVLLDRTRK
jgi:hypothetical protein